MELFDIPAQVSFSGSLAFAALWLSSSALAPAAVLLNAMFHLDQKSLEHFSEKRMCRSQYAA
jgi:hypothetical protein